MIAPRISIIVPAYNVGQYVGATMESLLNQRVAAYEILVFDDGSADHTLEVLRTYEQYSQVRLYSQQNKGVGPTRNRGVELATGDYIYFVDADDWLDAGFVEDMQARIIQHDNPDLILFSSESFADDSKRGTPLHHYRRGIEADRMTGLEAFPLLTTRGWLDAPVWIYLARRSFWLEAGLSFDNALYEDEDVIVPLLAAAESVVITDQLYYYHRIRAGSLTASDIMPRHVHGRENSLRHAISAISVIPRRERETRRFLRKRCRIFARKYLDVALAANRPIRRGLLLHAALATANIRLLRTIVSRLWAGRRLVSGATRLDSGSRDAG